MFLRDFNIKIYTPQGDLIEITPPFTIQFSITRNTLASANNCSLTIQGLGQATRSKLFKDRYTIADYWQMIISAGYDSLSTVFQGNLLECYSYKQGTEWYTKIEAFDGLHGIQNGFTSTTISKNTSKKQVIEKVIKDMPNIIKGVLGSPAGEDTAPRGQVLLGQSSKVLNDQTGGQYFIDNEVVNVVEDKEYIGETIINLDSSILLSTPRRRETFLDCEILFFPEATIGNLCKLTSLVPEYNGEYKIVGFKHDVTVSGSTVGTAKTQINLFSGANALKKASI